MKIKGEIKMNIVGITSCTVGIAHTYMAREKLISTGEKLGINIKIEAQGSGGTEFTLTSEDIKNADAVIIAADVTVAGKDRFKGKPIVEVPISVGIKSPTGLLTQIMQKVGNY